MKYLVLGSAGVIGSDLVRLLKEKGHTVFEFDIARSSDEDLRISNNKKLYIWHCQNQTISKHTAYEKEVA